MFCTYKLRIQKISMLEFKTDQSPVGLFASLNKDDEETKASSTEKL